MVSRLRTRSGASLARLAGGHDGPGAGRNSHAHDSRQPGRGVDATLRDDGDCERCDTLEGDFPPRAEERADSGDHGARAAVRIAADRSNHHGANFLLAGPRTATAAIDFESRLSTGPGVDPCYRIDIHS